MAKSNDKKDIEELLDLLSKASFIADRLCRNGVKLRLAIGQKSVVEKVLHENHEKPVILDLVEAIKHTTIYNLNHKVIKDG